MKNSRDKSKFTIFRLFILYKEKLNKCRQNSKYANLTNHFFLSLISLLYGFYLLIPVSSWIKIGENKKNFIPYFPYDDSVFYLMQIKNIIKNKGSFGNPYFFEHSIASFDIPDSYILWTWAQAGIFLNVNVIQIFLMMTVFTGFFTFFISVKMLQNYFFNTVLSYVVSFFLLLICLPFSLARPSPTSLAFPILLLCIFLSNKFVSNISIKSILQVDIIFSVLILANPIYAVFIWINFFLLFLKFNFLRRYLKIFFFPLTSIQLIITLLSKTNGSESQFQTTRRLGLLETHLPTSIKLVVFMLLAIFFLNYIAKDKLYFQILILNCFALLIAANQNVLSGKWWEPESHYWLITIYLLVISLTEISRTYFGKSLSNVFFCIVIVYFGHSAIIQSLNIQSEVRKSLTQYQSQSNLIRELEKEKYGEKVFLLPKSINNIELSPSLPLLMSGYTYWDRGGVAWSMDDSEVLNRYACYTKLGAYSFEDFSEDIPKIYSHRFANSEAFYKKWNSLFNFLFDKQIHLSNMDAVLKKDFLKVLNSRLYHCNPGHFLYKVDWIISPSGKWQKVNF